MTVFTPPLVIVVVDGDDDLEERAERFLFLFLSLAVL